MAIDQTTNTNAKKSCFNLVVMIGVHFTSLLKKKKKKWHRFFVPVLCQYIHF